MKIQQNFDLIKFNNRDLEPIASKKISSEKAEQTASDFQNMIVGFLYKVIDETLEVDPLFGGGTGEEIFRSIKREEEIKNANIDLGIKDIVLKQILQYQEMKE